GQTIIGAPEIKSLVLDACPEIPLPGNEKPMSVAEVIVERIAMAEVAVDVVEIAAERVVHLIIEQIAMVFIRRCGRRLRLICRRAGDGGGSCTEKQADKEQSYAFHRLRKANHRCIE